jgi:hypothetical protein
LVLTLFCFIGCESPTGVTGNSAGASGGGGAAGAAATTGVAGTPGAAGTTNAGGTAGSAGNSGSTGSAGSSGVPDAGAPNDGASSDVPRIDATPAVACRGEVLCFDFENDTAGASPGAPWTGQGTIDTSKAVSGKNSLHVMAGSDNAFALMKPPSIFPPPANEYYGRVRFWVDALPSGHWTFVRSKGQVPGKTYSAEYTYGGTGKNFIANYDTGGVSSDCWKDAGAVPLGEWACMEWHFKGATNELQLWINGTEDAAAHVIGTGDGCIANGTGGVWYAPTFGSLELGFAVYGGGTNFSVWYDDLALGKVRVGCQ